ncbi:unnamed protein product [Peniophora sp. CBMAI 1063]|nr:unnamed protein product [Peniophora sp. CBMAI 1063]
MTTYERAPLDDLDGLKDDHFRDGMARSASRLSSTSTLVPSNTHRARRSGAWKAYLLILSPLIFASAICAGHHVFLSVLDGKDVDSFSISQTWFRDAGNALAKIVQFLLIVSVGIVLTQSIWSYIRGHRVTLRNLDALYSLPSFSSLPSMAAGGRIVGVLLLAVVMKTLSLVSIFAPNALSVVPASYERRDLIVPVPGLDGISLPTSSYFFRDGLCAGGSSSTCDDGFFYMNPSSSFQRLTRRVLDGGAILPWAPPPGCSRGCSYDVHYWGPALNCTIIPPSSIEPIDTDFASSSGLHSTTDIKVTDPTHYLEGAHVYNATTNFGSGYTWNGGQDQSQDSGYVKGSPIAMFFSSPPKDSFSFDVVYATNEFKLPFTSQTMISYNLTGYTCAFHNASYTASVNYTNGFQTTSIDITDYGAPLGSVQDLHQELPASYVHETDPDILSSFAATSLANAMSQYVYGNIALTEISLNNLSYPTLAPAYTSVLNSIFTTQTTLADGSGPSEADTLSLSLISSAYDNLGQLLEDACTNLTASLMSDTANLGLNQSVSAIVIPDHNIYKYKPFRLWLVYGIALLVTLVADIYGLICILANGGAMQRDFSSIAASVRSRDLDALLGEPGEPLTDRAKKVKLRYRGGNPVKGWRAGFTVAENPRGEEDAEMMAETTRLTKEL